MNVNASQKSECKCLTETVYPDMPVLKPVPIGTKGRPWFKKIRRWLFGVRKWELVFDYYIYLPWLEKEVKVPGGFIFDGASVPKPLWPLLNPTGILLIPGLLHDYGYKYNCWLDEEDNKIFDKAGQKFFDQQFGKVAMYVNDMKFLDKNAFYALRLFGFKAWNDHRKEDKKIGVTK